MKFQSLKQNGLLLRVVQALVHKNGKLLHPKLYWIFDSTYTNLAKIAIDVFCFNSSAAAGERNFKSMKRVQGKTTNSLRDEKMIRRTAIHYNSNQLKRGDILTARTQEFILKFVETRFDPPADLPKLLESAQAALAEQLQEEIAESQE